jgi:hypothetical protein
MTEAEWRACTDPDEMLDQLGSKAGERKLQLFTVACCRRIWASLGESGARERSRHAVEVAERFAEGQATTEELAAARLDAEAAAREAAADFLARHDRGAEGAASAREAAYLAASETISHTVSRAAAAAANHIPFPQPYFEERKGQVALVRDIFGNPFRLVSLDSRWLTPAVVGLARTIYEERAFDRMPALAGTLRDAGCDNEDLLGHCQEPGEHARGCWVLDLLLGKA